MTHVLKQKNVYMKRCDKCKKLTHYIYRVNLGQFAYNLCSSFCVDAARAEYEYKQKNNITPTNDESIEDGGDLDG